MGWWPFSASSSSPRAEAIRAGDAIPTRSERQLCWAARDAFFACLDANSIEDPARCPRATCRSENAVFEQDCSRAWVDYFKKWRVADLQKRRRLEELRRQGAQEMSVTSSFAPDGGAGAGEKGAKGVGDIQNLLDRKRS